MLIKRKKNPQIGTKCCQCSRAIAQ